MWRLTASEYAAEGSVVIADDICWRPVPGECLGNLACQPLRRRMLGHRKPQQLPPSVAENKKCVELLKGNRRNYEEINRRDPVSVVAQEGLPRLRGSISPRYHVLRDCRLGDVEAELQKLAVDMRRTPERVLRIRSRSSLSICGRPPRGRDFHRQNALKPLRCQRTIVSGLKIIMASRMRGKPR